jgi:L-fuconolactonase
VNRRSFLAGAAVLAGGARAAAPIPIIDTHIHLFDTNRPQGVPWPSKTDKVLYRPALPERYIKIARPLGVTGAIEVEASPLFEDNQWVLDLIAKDKMFVGTVGDLEPGKPEFPKQLERFHRNPLFRGIRYGNLWGRNLGAELKKPEFVAGLKLLAQADMSLDTANPNPALIADVVRVTDLVPNLRIIIDHLPQLEVPTEASARKQYESHLREIGKHRQVYVKISQVFRKVNGKSSSNLSDYRENLDHLFETFGEDRVLYGSDWPNSDLWKPYPEILGIVREYFAGKGQSASEKYFWKNSVAAYKWVKRSPEQPGA